VSRDGRRQNLYSEMVLGFLSSAGAWRREGARWEADGKD
jgi:hypothetical protein